MKTNASSPDPKRIEERVGTLVPKRDPCRFNQALMELGAVCCMPKTPAEVNYAVPGGYRLI